MTKSESGLTLIELLIAASVSVMVGALILMIFASGNVLMVGQTAKINQGLDLNGTITEMRDGIRESSRVVNTNLVGSPQYTTSNNTLVLAVPSLDSSGNSIPNTIDYLIFTQDTGTKILRKKLFPSTSPASYRPSKDLVLTTRLSSVSFEYLSQSGVTVNPATAAERIRFTLTLADNVGQSIETKSETVEVAIRNN